MAKQTIADLLNAGKASRNGGAAKPAKPVSLNRNHLTDAVAFDLDLIRAHPHWQISADTTGQLHISAWPLRVTAPVGVYITEDGAEESGIVDKEAWIGSGESVAEMLAAMSAAAKRLSLRRGGLFPQIVITPNDEDGGAHRADEASPQAQDHGGNYLDGYGEVNYA